MSKEIALKEHRAISLFPTESEWVMLKEQASMVVRTGLLPRGIDTPEKAIAIALKGRELGIPPMHAFAHIHIIQGKPTISAELMLALIYKNCPGAVIDYVENGATKCVIRATRPGSKPATWAFSIEEAKTAGLMNKDSWKNYPAAMLRARAISIMARAVFPDAIMGCGYTPEELGAEVDDEGEVIDIPPGPPAAKGPSPTLKPAVTIAPEKRSRKEISDEIQKWKKAMSLTNKQVEEWVEELFQKGPTDLSSEELESLLAHMQHEAGREGIKVS